MFSRKMSDQRQQIGRWGEKTAAEYLIAKGYQIVGTNVQVGTGEIDLIASFQTSTGVALVFVEVKTRTSLRYGYPEEAISAKKWNRLMRSIDDYLLRFATRELDWRMDVIAIQKDAGDDPPQIVHFENVIMPDEND